MTLSPMPSQPESGPPCSAAARNEAQLVTTGRPEMSAAASSSTSESGSPRVQSACRRPRVECSDIGCRHTTVPVTVHW